MRNASEDQCKLLGENDRVNLMNVGKAPGAPGEVTGESLEVLEKLKEKLKAKKEKLETQLAQLDDSDSENITYSDDSD